MYWKVKGTIRLQYRQECGCEFCEGHERWLRQEDNILIVTDDDVEATRHRSTRPIQNWHDEEQGEMWVKCAAIDLFLHKAKCQLDNWQEAEFVDWDALTVGECGEGEVMYLMGYVGLFDIPGLPTTGAALPSTSGGG